MEKIKLKNIKIYAYHGCLEEEAKIGSYYIVNLTIHLDLKKAGESDNLNDTINYAELTRIIHEQMAIRSNLLEHVTQRIATSIGSAYPVINKIKVSVAKVNPPVPANIDEAKVTFVKKFH